MRQIALRSFLSNVLILMRRGIGSIVAALLLTGSLTAVAAGEPLFDDTRSVVLPSEDAAPILKRLRGDNDWSTDEWSISSETLNYLEAALAAAMGKVSGGMASFKAHDFYRQYMPARWKDHRVIIVNGFYSTPSDLFPTRGIPPDQWKHELVTAFGGGCAYWHAVYIVEQKRLLDLKTGDRSRRATLICNGPK
jgi:hypothetical protein